MLRKDAGIWQEFFTEEGDAYYYNSRTGEAVVEKPPAFIQDWLDAQDPEELIAVSKSGRVGGPWTEHVYTEVEEEEEEGRGTKRHLEIQILPPL